MVKETRNYTEIIIKNEYQTSSVRMDNTELTCEEMVDLFRSALCGAGYGIDTINKYLDIE